MQTRPADDLTLSAAVGYSLDSRRAKDDARLRGLGDVNRAPSMTLGIDYRSGDAFLNSQLRSRQGDDNERGTTAELDLGYNVIASRAGSLGLDVTARAMDGTYAADFFSVNAAQSAASGWRQFAAEGGVQRVG